MVVGLLGNESSDSNRFTLVTPKSENDVRLQATLGNQNPTGLPMGVVSSILLMIKKCLFLMLLLNQDAETTGISIMVQDRSYYVLQEEGIIRNGENLLRNSMWVIQFILRQKSNIGMVQHQKAILYILQKVYQMKMLPTSGLKQWMKKNI